MCLTVIPPPSSPNQPTCSSVCLFRMASSLSFYLFFFISNRGRADASDWMDAAPVARVLGGALVPWSAENWESERCRKTLRRKIVSGGPPLLSPPPPPEKGRGPVRGEWSGGGGGGGIWTRTSLVWLLPGFPPPHPPPLSPQPPPTPHSVLESGTASLRRINRHAR